MSAQESPDDLCKRLTTASMSLFEVKPTDMMQAVIVRATQELLLQTAAWIAQQEADKHGL